MYASLLTLYTVNSKVVDNQSLFRQIVTIDYWRILSRLRSKHAKTTFKTKDRPALIKLLSTTIHDKSVKARGGVTHKKLEEIRARVDHLNALYDKFENIKKHRPQSLAVQDTSMDLIRQAYELSLLPELRSVLSSSQIDQPGLKIFLPEAIGKLGRYYRASLELVSAARNERYRIFNHIAVEVVQLQGTTKLVGPIIYSTLLNAAQNAIRPKGSLKQRAMSRSIETYLKKPLAEVQRAFQSRIVRTELLKVHAEIQLLFYYERRPNCLMIPKVICSSKSACYLCDLFIRLHGKFAVPRTHGRIYDKWILPDFVEGISIERQRELGKIVRRFNEDLETKIRLTLNSYRQLCNYPNESVLIPPALLSSSTIGMIQHPNPQPLEAESTNHPSEIKIVTPEQYFEAPSVSSRSEMIFARNSNGTIRPSGVRTKGESSTASILPEIISHSTRQLADTNDILLDSNILKDLPSKNSSIITVQQLPPERSPSTYEHLVQGSSLRKQLVHPIQVVRVSTDSMHLDLSREDATSDDVTASKGCWVEVEWFDTYEQSRTSDDKVILDLRNMAGGSPITTHHGGALTTTSLYLQMGQELLSIKFGFEP